MISSPPSASTGSSLYMALPPVQSSSYILGAQERITSNGFSLYTRSEEHTSELQSRGHLVCRLLLEKKNQPGVALHVTWAVHRARYRAPPAGGVMPQRFAIGVRACFSCCCAPRCVVFRFSASCWHFA